MFCAIYVDIMASLGAQDRFFSALARALVVPCFFFIRKEKKGKGSKASKREIDKREKEKGK